MNQLPQWEELDHPADVRLRIRGDTLQDLFDNAADALIEVLVDPESVQGVDAVDLEAEGTARELLLIHWLQEILFLFDAEEFAPSHVEHIRLEEGHVRGRLRGERIDPSRHEIRNQPKAVTRHEVDIAREDGGYEVTVVIDV
ncbi:MAG: archease [Planctomycetota bacterium]